METNNQNHLRDSGLGEMDSFIEDERLKSTMTITRAINLLKDKHAVRNINYLKLSMFYVILQRQR